MNINLLSEMGLCTHWTITEFHVHCLLEYLKSKLLTAVILFDSFICLTVASHKLYFFHFRDVCKQQSGLNIVLRFILEASIHSPYSSFLTSQIQVNIYSSLLILYFSNTGQYILIHTHPSLLLKYRLIYTHPYSSSFTS